MGVASGSSDMPVDGPTPMHIWTAQIGLSGLYLLFFRSRHKVGVV